MNKYKESRTELFKKSFDSTSGYDSIYLSLNECLYSEDDVMSEGIEGVDVKEIKEVEEVEGVDVEGVDVETEEVGAFILNSPLTDHIKETFDYSPLDQSTKTYKASSVSYTHLTLPT